MLIVFLSFLLVRSTHSAASKFEYRNLTFLFSPTIFFMCENKYFYDILLSYFFFPVSFLLHHNLFASCLPCSLFRTYFRFGTRKGKNVCLFVALSFFTFRSLFFGCCKVNIFILHTINKKTETRKLLNKNKQIIFEVN